MLHLSQDLQQEIYSDARRTFPDECCGFLLGEEQGEKRLITEIIVIDNARKSNRKRRFKITPVDYLKAEQYAEEHQLTLLGVYHSHPNHPSVPSEHDRVSAQPYFSYVIIAVTESEFVSIQSWRLNEDFQFEEEQISKEALKITTKI